MKLRRQLTDEETRIYAAGMSARRRGEKGPEEDIPQKMHAIWWMGWRRVCGRPPWSPVTRSDDHTTLAQGRHVVRTEVETLDQALDVLLIKKRGETLKANQRPRTLAQQFASDRQRHAFKKRNDKRQAELAPFQEAVSEFEQRSVERVVEAIRLLRSNIEEMSSLSAVKRFYPSLSRDALLNVVEKLAHMIKQDMPAFRTERMAGGHIERRRCGQCGCELAFNEILYCLHCEPPDESIKIASDMRREHLQKLSGTKAEAREIGAFIRQLKRKAIDHDDDH